MTSVAETVTRGQTLTRGVAHIKARSAGGGYLLERCEDPGCRVDDDGYADCGRSACPSCGYGGANLQGDELMLCSCGHLWIRPDRQR